MYVCYNGMHWIENHLIALEVFRILSSKSSLSKSSSSSSTRGNWNFVLLLHWWFDIQRWQETQDSSVRLCCVAISCMLIDVCANLRHTTCISIGRHNFGRHNMHTHYAYICWIHNCIMSLFALMDGSGQYALCVNVFSVENYIMPYMWPWPLPQTSCFSSPGDLQWRATPHHHRQCCYSTTFACTTNMSGGNFFDKLPFSNMAKSKSFLDIISFLAHTHTHTHVAPPQSLCLCVHSTIFTTKIQCATNVDLTAPNNLCALILGTLHAVCCVQCAIPDSLSSGHGWRFVAATEYITRRIHPSNHLCTFHICILHMRECQ